MPSPLTPTPVFSSTNGVAVNDPLNSPVFNAGVIQPLANRTEYLNGILAQHTGSGVGRFYSITDLSPSFSGLRGLTGMTTNDGVIVRDAATQAVHFFFYDGTSTLTDSAPSVVKSGTGAWVNINRDMLPKLELATLAKLESSSPALSMYSDPTSPSTINLLAGASQTTVALPQAAQNQFGWVIEMEGVVQFTCLNNGLGDLAAEVRTSPDLSFGSLIREAIIDTGSYWAKPFDVKYVTQGQIFVKNTYFSAIGFGTQFPTVLTPKLQLDKINGSLTDDSTISTCDQGIPNRLFVKIYRTFA